MVSNGRAKMLWDFQIQTDKQAKVNQPDIVKAAEGTREAGEIQRSERGNADVVASQGVSSLRGQLGAVTPKLEEWLRSRNNLRDLCPGEHLRTDISNTTASTAVLPTSASPPLTTAAPPTTAAPTTTTTAPPTTTTTAPPTTTTIALPGSITNLSPQIVGTTFLYVTWTRPGGALSFYRVSWTGGNSNNSLLANQNSTNITTLTPGVRYYVTVRAVAADNRTEGNSQTISVYTKPEAVKNLTVTDFSTTSVFLNWSEPNGERSFYLIKWRNETAELSKGVSDTHINVTELTPGERYCFHVTAVAGEDKTESDEEIKCQHTKPDKVSNLTVTDFTTTSMSLNWPELNGEISFYSIKYTKPDVVRYLTVTEITTSSISLNWTELLGKNISFNVQWADENQTKNSIVLDTKITIKNLMPGVLYKITVTPVAGDNYTQGANNSVSQYTKPAVVRNLTVIDFTTTSVSLKWTEPEGFTSFYTVVWTNNSLSQSLSVNNAQITIPKLTPGVQYNFSITAVDGDNITKGEATTVSLYTKPQKPENIMATERGTDYLNINWTSSQGGVDYYMVNITNADVPYNNWTKTTAITSNFTGLLPGRVFTVTVTAMVGVLATMSDQSSFATYPKPTESIIICCQTNSSLLLQWTTPPMMDGAPNISYFITYQSVNGSSNKQTKNSTENSTELSGLASGTLYNIAITTIGPQKLNSIPALNSSYTLPNPVQNVVAFTNSTTLIKVVWSEPLGVQQYFQYLVETYNETALVNSQTVNLTSCTVPNLEPGSRYFINVTTRVAQVAKATPQQASCYTNPKAVTNLTTAMNTTFIKLTWLRQSDYKSSYSYVVETFKNNELVYNNSVKNESIILNNLIPGTLYTFYVSTVVDRAMSTKRNTTQYTIPEKVSAITTMGTTTTLSVTWTQAPGKVSSYVITLYKGSQTINQTDLTNDTKQILYEGLMPGVLYCMDLFTKSESVTSNNASTCNATFPNPPGPIMVDFQTVSSINFTWSLPDNMDYQQYNFSVSINGTDSSSLIKNNWFWLRNLSSGSPYSISVKTVGVWGYSSTAKMTRNYTRPYSVTNLRQTEITMHNLTLKWDQPEIKSDYSYQVQANSTPPDLPGSLNMTPLTVFTVTGLYSGSNYSFTATTLTADGTRAESVTASYFTRPYAITQLTASTLNTTAVHLYWTKPNQYKSNYRYWVKTTGCGFQNVTSSVESVEISELTPGTNCTFCVFVMAANGIQGEARCTNNYTKPELVLPAVCNEGSNSSVKVSWTHPSGNVEKYILSLNSTSKSFYNTVQLDPTSTTSTFYNLSAGVLYSAMLTTCSGPFCVLSEFVTNATYPNPPGSIQILEKTTSYIKCSWEEAPQMTNASFNYVPTITQSLQDVNTSIIPPGITRDHFFNFSLLFSGTSYNISVITRGLMGFESEAVYSNMVTTRPLIVENIMTAAGEKSISITWIKPADYKKTYSYIVTWQKSNGTFNSMDTSDTKSTINDLVPGSQYNINVTTKTSDGTQAAPQNVSICTNASPVKDLKWFGPNSGNAELYFNWTKPEGESSGFQFSLIDSSNTIQSSQYNSIASCCQQNISNLRYNNHYNVTVKTLSCGLPSTPVVLSCLTGITSPPIPPNYELLAHVNSTLHNKFTVKIDPGLLDDSHGPVTHIGILITSDENTKESADKIDLERTYNNWRSKTAPVYLATIENRTNNLQGRSSASSLAFELGSGTTWNDYSNGALDPSGTYKYAVVIFTFLNTKPNLVNSQTSIFSITKFSPTVTLSKDPAVTAIAVGATLGIFGILFIILMGFIIHSRSLSSKESSDLQIQPIRAKVSAAVRVEDFEIYYRKQKADSSCGFAEEFEDLKPVGISQAKTHALALDNKPKNRYNNVLPYDSSRVKLSIIHGSPNEDYINANYMPGYLSRKEFIAAQGPLPATVSDFWRMIWEKNVLTLVMLTRCNEQGRVKCEQYWDSGTKHYEDITVTTTSEIALEDWTIRDFDVKNVKTTEVRSVRQFHFTAWPDHGVPETTELLISFRHLVREHMNQYSRHSPTVVHCSAGVGRTGTFISIDRLIFQIERENVVDVYGIVHDLRMHRPLMVQTEDQYVFLNLCALDIIRSRTGTNVDLIYQNTAAISIYENVDPKKGYGKREH
ncbi:receptor-type tyrosine-protein phosphatase eta [Nematolebias whitei]|uniref:receptor-type tyrosine-protein phosphatase eta n=1 Tax=Nematolebias whitei TaxID=451745 RepID=UPI00189847DF|nr:receptor-type tyrosine-protein phosphatase eta [Nematolebias whitei]